MQRLTTHITALRTITTLLCLLGLLFALDAAKSSAQTNTPTVEPTVTPTIEPTAAPTEVETTQPTATSTVGPTGVYTLPIVPLTPTPIGTLEPTTTPTVEPTTGTPIGTPTGSATPTPTPAPSETPSPEPTESVTPQPTTTVTETPSETPPVTPSVTPSVVPSETPSETPSATPSETAMPEPTTTIMPTVTPTGTLTVTPTPVLSETTPEQMPESPMDLVSGGRTITVIGASALSGELHVAQAQIVVDSLQPTIQDASRQVDERMASVMQALQNQGTDPADIHLVNHSIVREGSATTGGYRASKQLAVTIRNMDQIETTLDSTIVAGANPFVHVTFTRADAGDGTIEAWVDALQNARERASQVATALNVNLGDVLHVRELDDISAPTGDASLPMTSPRSPLGLDMPHSTLRVEVVFSIVE